MTDTSVLGIVKPWEIRSVVYVDGNEVSYHLRVAGPLVIRSGGLQEGQYSNSLWFELVVLFRSVNRKTRVSC